MKNIADVLRQKEAELQQIQVEVDALRLTFRLLAEDGEQKNPNGRILAPTGTTPGSRVEEIRATDPNPRRFP
jgi:hypothetical protein